MRGASVATLRGKPGVGTPHQMGETLPTLTIRGDQLAFRVATDAAWDGEQVIGQLTSGGRGAGCYFTIISGTRLAAEWAVVGDYGDRFVHALHAAFICAACLTASSKRRDLQAKGQPDGSRCRRSFRMS